MDILPPVFSWGGETGCTRGLAWRRRWTTMDDDGRRWTTTDDDDDITKKNWTHPPYGHHVSRFFMGRGDGMHTGARKTTTTEPPVTSCFPFFHGAGKQAAQGGRRRNTTNDARWNNLYWGKFQKRLHSTASRQVWVLIQVRSDKSSHMQTSCTFARSSGLLRHHADVIMQRRNLHYRRRGSKNITNVSCLGFEFKAPFHSNLNQRQSLSVVHSIGPWDPALSLTFSCRLSRNIP